MSTRAPQSSSVSRAVQTRSRTVCAGASRAVRTSARGLTLVELVLALGLLSLLMVALIQLLDRTLSLWRRSETRRSLTEQAAMVTDLMADDLRGMEGGARGDLVCEWVRFDTDKDGLAETKWPRLRVVRPLSAGHVARVLARAGTTEHAAAEASLPGLSEVIWLVVPAAAGDASPGAEGRLWRGERLIADARTKSFFADDFLGPSNLPPGGVTEEVCDGVLWLCWTFAGPASLVHEDWDHDQGPDGVLRSWDAWGRARPDAELHVFNDSLAPAPSRLERPRLPRRVRIEIELERAADRVRRTTLSEDCEANATALSVDNSGRVPHEDGACILIDAEWMRVRSVDGDTVHVVRAQRGTPPVRHVRGAMVHHGSRLVREVPVVAARQEWKP